MNYSQRFEKKFFINFLEENKIKDKFENFFKLEFEQGYYCCSIYFDDLDFSTLKQKQEGITERFKIRLRAYFFDLKDEPKFWNLEIKSKNNNTVKKKKIIFSHLETIENLKKKNFAFFSNKFHETAKTYFKPTSVTFYFREAFTSKILPHCRMTFDKNIRSFNYDLRYLDNLANNDNFIINPKYILLEFKYTNFLPLFISDYFKFLNLDQVTFSKYVDGFEKTKMII
ncbi:VTC domain-containing protein [Candidatus Pelagibacter sp.]|nr:VTC domain-containing protein [Candidatus Pelagibacter sp.]